MVSGGCHPYPAVKAAGEISDELRPAKGSDGYLNPPLGAQVYGRAVWKEDIWATMFAWYFSQGSSTRYPNRRHDWANVVVWIDNPELETPAIMGISTSYNIVYDKFTLPEDVNYFNGSSPVLYRKLQSVRSDLLACESRDEGAQDEVLIMWEQLTEEAWMALNDMDNFGRADMPFSEENFLDSLDHVWPF